MIWDSGKQADLIYEQLCDKLSRRYGSEDQQEKFQAELRARRRRRGESLAELYQDIKRLMAMAYPDEGPTTLCEHIAKEHFITSLDDRNLELKLREREPRDLDAAFKCAVRLEAYERALTGARDAGSKSRDNRPRRDDVQSRKVSQLDRQADDTPQSISVSCSR